MEAMAEMPDNLYDLAIVDPPYGMKRLGMQSGGESVKKKHFKRCLLGWDERPQKKYFTELQRVSRHQIIWGGNYFTKDLPESRCWLCWDKKIYVPTYSRFELAWTSFKTTMSLFECHNRESERIHVTQKPVRLYKWLLSKYAKKGWVILDTHLGSGSSAIAAHDMGFNFVGYELDKDYYKDALKRLHRHQRQLRLFVD
jgi:site-specific DNA-methyltransferase (adenine-specific)